MKKLLSAAVAAILLIILALHSTVLGAGPPPPPPPPPGGNPPTITPPCPPIGCPTATPLPTATPTLTPTPVPVTVTIKLAHSAVSPRSKQKVTATTQPGVNLTILVKFPNGDTKSHTAAAAASGKLSWSYTQPGSRITHSSRAAKVTITATNGTTTATAIKRYTINFALLDVTLDSRTVHRGHAAGVWIHSAGRERVQAVVQLHKATAVAKNGITAASGWVHFSFPVASNAPKGTARVWGYGYPRSGRVSGQTSFQVK